MYEPTTVAEIRGWLEDGNKNGVTHCLVICDTWIWQMGMRIIHFILCLGRMSIK